MGSEGSEPHRQTFSGRLQLSHIRLRDSDPPSTPEEEAASASERSRRVSSPSRSMRRGRGLLMVFTGLDCVRFHKKNGVVFLAHGKY